MLRTGRNIMMTVSCVATLATVSLLFAQSACAAQGAIAYVSTPDWHVPFAVDPYEVMSWESPQIVEASSDGTQARVIATDAFAPEYSPDDARLVYEHANPIDGSSQGIYIANADGSGARKVISTVGDSGPVSWAPDSSHLVFANGGLEIVGVNGKGRRQLTTGRPVNDTDPSWGPAGQIAFARYTRGFFHIYLIEPNGTHVRQVTSGRTNDLHPSWSPDGATIAFDRESRDQTDLYTTSAIGTDLRRLTDAGPNEADERPAWSPDQTEIAYSEWGPFGNDDEIMTINVATGARRQLSFGPGSNLDPTWTAQALPPPATPVASKAGLRPRFTARWPRPARGRHRPPVATSARKRWKVRARRRPIPGLRPFLQQTNGAGGGEPCGDETPIAPWYPGPLVTVGSYETDLAYHAYDQTTFDIYHDARLQAGTSDFFCFWGFPDHKTATPLRVKLTHPSGRVTSLKANYGFGVPATLWMAPLTSPGEYRVTATQGYRKASAIFWVVLADTPHLVIPFARGSIPKRLRHKRVRDFQLISAGLPPHERMTVDMYRQGKDHYKFVYSVTLPAHAGGTQRYTIVPTTPAPPGLYLFVLRRHGVVVDPEIGAIDARGGAAAQY
jgi:hypothetical protein